MCLIVDANVVNRVFLIADDPDFKDLYASLFATRKPVAKIIYGGKLIEEYSRSHHEVIRILLQLDQAGRATKVDDSLIDGEHEIIIKMKVCKSNDTHIIALARAGKVRLLCSHDKPLATDFKNKALLNKPRGKVYKSSKHNNLLDKFCG
jgi:predicted nucleic acid-binding protein